MILVWGSQSDPPAARMLEVLAARGADFCHVDDTILATMQYDLAFEDEPSGWIELHGRRIDVKDLRGVYLRPEQPPASDAARASAIALMALASGTNAVVLNRPAAGRSNAAKPYQLGLIADAGFDVPETLVTTDPEAARRFLRRHGRIVYKSLSAVRSIVATLEPDGAARLEQVRSGPVQLQAYVPGVDVRVHVVGAHCFACAIRSDATDYRYASATGDPVELSACELPRPVARRVISLAHGMGLRLAGVDLRRTPNGRWICFEVNPSPGFTWYEEQTDQPIAETIADLLADAA